MDAVLVKAVLPIASLDAVEQALLAMGVSNLSVTKARGCSRCIDFLSRDHLAEQARLEVFTAPDDAMRVVDAILEAAKVRESGDGVVAILPTQAAFNLGSRSGIGQRADG